MPVALKFETVPLPRLFLAQQRPILGEQARMLDLVEKRQPQICP